MTRHPFQGLTRYEGTAPPAFGVYRPANVFGMPAGDDVAVMIAATMLGIGFYALPDIATLRGLSAHAGARDEASARLQEIEAEAAGAVFSSDQDTEFQATTELIGTLDAAIEQLEARELVIRQVTAAQDQRRTEGPSIGIPNVASRKRTPDNIYDMSAYRQLAGSLDDLPGLYRDGAMRAIENMDFPLAREGANADIYRAQLEQIIARHGKDANGAVSRRIIGTSDPRYVDGFSDYIRGRGVDGRMMAVMQSYSDSDGGVSVPVEIDPTFINVSDGSANPLRAISRIVTTTGKTWSAVTTEGVTAAYRAERTTTGISDGAPSDLDDPTATPVGADVSVDLSIEYLQDYGSAALLGEIGTLIADAKDTLEADQFVLGDGTDAPEGIVAAIIADTTSIVTTTTNDAFLLADIDKLIGQLPPRFRALARAKFLANNAILQRVPAFGTAGQTAGSIYDAQTSRLRGYPVYEASAMDDVTTDSKHVLLFGDFGRGFVIVDKLGMTVRALPTYDSGGRPTLGTTVTGYWRNTSKVLAFNAFRLLEID